MADNTMTITATNGVAHSGPEIMFIGFADNKVPEFKEVKSKNWILFGVNNLFPDHLLYLYNKSSNHAAIVNGKVVYITGKGFQDNFTVNMRGEKINRLMKKTSKDIELFGGFYWQVTWKPNGKADISHIDFLRLRKDKDKTGYWYKKDWAKLANRDDDPKLYPNFDPNNKTGIQIFAYMEYRPGCEYYPLPGYFSAANDIETDCEISKYNLSVIKQGMFSSKLITFHTGDPGEEGKRKLEKGFRDKFSGSENAGKFMLVFNTKPELAPTVEDLSTTDLDKLFQLMRESVKEEIFSGHNVTSPILFGVMSPGKLGETNTMQDSYEIFKNTYINDKQMDLEEIIDYMGAYVGWPTGQKIIPVNPLSLKFNPVDFKDILPRSWVYENLGIDPNEYPDAPAAANVSGETAPAFTVDKNISGMSGRENINLNRIIRQYKKGLIPKVQAEIMLKKGFYLNPEEINAFLSFAITEREVEVAEMFSSIGSPRQEFTVVKSRAYKFAHEAFTDINQTDSNILDLIRKDHKITPETIATTLKEPIDYIKSRINSLRERKVIKPRDVTVGVDTVIEHTINPEVIDTREKPETVNMYIRYSYEPKPGLEAIIPGSRPFCRKLIELDRLYSRAEIESISQRVGYSVWDRKGGFWNDGGDIKDECRHQWVSNVVIKRST